MATEITRVTSAEARQIIWHGDPSLETLVLNGYDLNPDVRDDLGSDDFIEFDAATFEYGTPSHRSAVFLAEDKGEFIGSLSLELWQADADKQPYYSFWNQMRKNDPELAEKMVVVSPLACHVSGVVTAPNRRSEGLGTLLFETAIDELNPSVIVGQTKTVGAVMTRRKLGGFRTFYGESEVTEGFGQPVTDEHTSLVHAYLTSQSILVRTLDLEGYAYMSGTHIASTIPDLTTAPEVVFDAFKPIVSAQKKIKGDWTIMAPLLSIREAAMPIRA